MTDFPEWYTEHMFILNLLGWGLGLVIVYGLFLSAWGHLQDHFNKPTPQDRDSKGND